MATLDSTLRDRLATVIGKENTDGGARALAAAGARAAIEALAVHLAAPHAHHDDASRQLRNRVRARARQLGDIRHGDGRHEIDRLVEQAAYEHWHRMLFARFLAENDLLIHPEMRVAVTLAECAEMAASEGATDGWELAGRYASRMLPQIFRPDDPLLAVRFALDDVRKLEDLLESLPAELFRASDSLGWCYQFWQAQRKKAVNASEVKIGADELPAVTQLFTEPYMVQFLLHNTLGAWCRDTGRELPFAMQYLRDDAPLTSTFSDWPRFTAELKVLDPCCGSGHFLVAAFEILVAFRMAEEGLSAREACDAVLRDNLFGLEIDARCVQIGAFALALAAWRFPNAGGYRTLPVMNVACSGLAISAKKEEWEKVAGSDAKIRSGMGRMWELFKDAPVLGSLIDPTRTPSEPLLMAGFDDLEPFMRRALQMEALDAEAREMHVAAQGVAAAASLLSRRYHLVMTNVPFLYRGKQCERLKKEGDTSYPRSKGDLCTMMTERLLGLSRDGGIAAIVSPQNWMLQTTYGAFRKDVLSRNRLVVLADLGPAAFQIMNWWAFNTVLFGVQTTAPLNDDSFLYFDVSETHVTSEKSQRLLDGATRRVDQLSQLGNPDHKIAPKVESGGVLLNHFAETFQGIKTGDDSRFRRCFWEVQHWTHWRSLQSTVDTTINYGGCHYVVNWSDAGDSLARKQGMGAWGRRGVVVSQMNQLPVCLYQGGLFDSNVSPIVPLDEADLPALWAYCASGEFRDDVRRLDQTLKVPNATLVKVVFDAPRWRATAVSEYSNGLPAPAVDDLTEWQFAGHPRGARSSLQVAVARLLGFRWPDQSSDAIDAHADNDGIVCIPASRGERPAADRLTDLLAAGWGKGWHPQTITDLLNAVGHKGSLEEWLRDDFFREHCELFHHRPFVWHIWDGHREGFSALVNYHKLDHSTLKSLTYTYLGDWIRNQESEAKVGKSGAGDKLAKAKVLQQRLALILEGDAPLDVFVRWKAIEKQPIGWDPDFDDGVRLNIRPFLTVATVGGKGAGVLRWRPNLKWDVDRGKNPEGSPWGEVRENDKHLTLAEKRKARVPL